jgi:membrane protein implicated in regulation of membrane protease activity
MEYFENIDLLLKTYWYVAIPSSLIFTIQTIMTFIGADASDGIEADFDGDLDGSDAPFQLFSFRNLINFLLGFSWTGVAFYSTIGNQFILLSLSLSVGLLFLYVFFLIIRQVQKLAENNSFQIKNTIDKTAEVYLTIPEKLSGSGKVLVSVNGSVHELAAMTEGDKLPSGTVVKIIKVESENILIVKSI